MDDTSGEHKATKSQASPAAPEPVESIRDTLWTLAEKVIDKPALLRYSSLIDDEAARISRLLVQAKLEEIQGLINKVVIQGNGEFARSMSTTKLLKRQAALQSQLEGAAPGVANAGPSVPPEVKQDNGGA